MITPSSTSSPLSGKAILVTGSTRGIGRAVAERLAADGAIVGVHGRNIDDATRVCEAIGAAAIPVAADLSTTGAGEDLVKAFTSSADGRLDGLVNNAGGGRAAPFRAMTTTRWRETMALNADAVLETCRAAYGIMRKQKDGVVVNVASIAAHGPGKWMGADYAAAKAAVVSLTRSLAFEAARFGIRVNAVSPGLVDTDMTAVLDDAMRSGLPIPLGRFAQPEEIAGVVRFLLSPASRYVTGQVLEPNGGLRM